MPSSPRLCRRSVSMHFKEAYTEAQHQSNSEADQQKCNYDRVTSTVQLMPGDTVLKKANMHFKGKGKWKTRWSKVEYEVICQVANGVPSYEIKDPSGNLQVVHHNQLFLLATPQGEVMPLNKNKDADPRRVYLVCTSGINSVGV